MPRVAARSQRFDFLSGVQEDLGRESKLRMFTLRVRFREKRLNSARGIDFFPILSLCSLPYARRNLP